ncbi:MAG: putative hydrolase of the superfamily [Solirubrobacteraceae bacterium]|nr:putative hydrolase of the superfamily [Solirubrobacteraceae bacterium]
MAPEARRGLLVDWGGVLTTNLFEAFAAFCAAEGLAPTTVRDAFLGDGRGLLADFECGRIGAPAFEAGFGDVLGVAEHEGLIGRLFGGLGPDAGMQDAVAALRRGGVRTGLLSNSWGAAGYDRSRFDELFDVLVISGEEGVRKPEPAIYALAAERMGLPPEALVFVDDIPGNLKPARAIGMATVHHVDAAQTIDALEELLGVSARPAPGGGAPRR